MSEGYDGLWWKKGRILYNEVFLAIILFYLFKTSEVKMPRQSGNLCLITKSFRYP